MHCNDGSMELQQMRYVVAVAQERNFTRAADRCFVVQSALSHQVKALERELGVTLFARTSRRVELTAAGAAFLPAAQAALEAADRAVGDATSASGLVRGSVTMGVIPTVTTIDVPDVLDRLRRAHPEVRVTLRGGGSTEFISAIREGHMDVAVLGLADTVRPEGVRVRELARARLEAVVAATHPLARRRRLRLADLADEPFVDFPAASPGRAQSDLAFRRAGLRREVAMEAADTHLMLDLVRRDLVVTLMPPGIAPDDPELRRLPVSDGPMRVEYLAWSDFNASAAARALLDVATRPQR